MADHRIAVIPGDGIGGEVVAEGIRALEAVTASGGPSFEFSEFPWGCAHYVEHSEMMPADGIETLASFDAIYLGAVGMPGVVAEEVAVRGLVLAIRFGFDQFANVRPVRPLPGCPFPLRNSAPEDIDITVVREATEGMYLGLGGRHLAGSEEFRKRADLRPAFGDSREIAIQTGIFSEAGCRRVIEYAFDLAEDRDGKRRVTSCTKANALNHGMTLWNEVFDETAGRRPDIAADWQNVDAMAMRLMLEPEEYDVIVAPNLFGDIITDLTAVLQGGLGLSPGGNISRSGPSMFEPPHGSAPDIAGKGIANPLAAILSAAMMLEHLGEEESARRIGSAAARLASEGGTLTPDMGGNASTTEVGERIAAHIAEQG